MTDRERTERELERAIFDTRTDRRRLIGRTGSAAFALTGLSAVPSACGGVEGEADKNAGDKKKTADHPKTAIDQLIFANWPLYIDKKVLKDFEKEFGGKVKFTGEINDNFEFFRKVPQQLQQGRDIG